MKYLREFKENITIEMVKKDSNRIYDYIAKSEGRVIGSLSVFMQPIDMDFDRHEDGYALINTVEINEDFRRMGIYTEMIKRATSDACNDFDLKGIVSRSVFWSDRSEKANRFWGEMFRTQKKLGLSIREDSGDYYIEPLSKFNI